MKASDYIINFLEEQGIDKVFGYVGGAVAHIYDSIDKSHNIEVVNTVSEQGAGFAADGYARVTGKTGVAIATSGPGATNLITAIGSAFFDSISVIFITGQVNSYEFKYNTDIRQIGFQETDISTIVNPITKYTVLIDDAKNLRYELEKSYFISKEGRKGPVLIDIPMNIQKVDIDFSSQKSFYGSNEHKKKIKMTVDYKVSEIIGILNNSQRSLVLIGGGARLSDAELEITKFLEKMQIPVVYSLMGKDLIKDDYKYNLGLIGSYGNRYGNFALANCDCLLVLGSRLDTRQTGTNLKSFCRSAQIVHVDIDERELGAKIKANLSVKADISKFINKLNVKLECINNDSYKLDEWRKQVLTYKNKYSSIKSISGEEKIPNLIINHISKYLKDDDIVSVDVGQHQMWVAQSLKIKGSQRVLFPGGMGAMGVALPTAIGASISSSRRVVVIAGDGGFQMNIQELEVIKRRNLPIKIFILNNSSLGMIKEFQKIYFEKRYIGSEKDYTTPSFKAVAYSYGIKSSQEECFSNKMYQKIESSLNNNTPELVDIMLGNNTVVEPKLIVNKPIEDMYPFLPRDQFEKEMIIKPFEEK